MPRKSQKKVVQKIVGAIKVLTEGELQGLAHAGTKEAVEKIEKYMKVEKDPEKNAYAQMALEECEFFYYQPTSEKEEEEFELSELIRRQERKIDDLVMKIKNIEARIAKLMLEKKVHEKVLAKYKNKKEAWQYNWMQDFVLMEENDLQEIKDQLEYEQAWVAEAKKMITTARYKTMPARHLEHFDFNFGEDFCDDDDDFCDDDCDDDCDCCDEPPF